MVCCAYRDYGIEVGEMDEGKLDRGKYCNEGRQSIYLQSFVQTKSWNFCRNFSHWLCRLFPDRLLQIVVEAPRDQAVPQMRTDLTHGTCQNVSQKPSHASGFPTICHNVSRVVWQPKKSLERLYEEPWIFRTTINTAKEFLKLSA